MEDHEDRSAPANGTQEKQGATAAAAPGQLDARGASRRRFTRAGAGAAGVILTLYSQPGMASSANRAETCTTPSGFMSIKGSSHDPNNTCSNNRSAAYWKANPGAWKARAGVVPETLFGDVLRAQGAYEGLKTVTLLQVLERPDAVAAIDTSFVASQAVTALLNARSARLAGTPSVLPEETVVTIWDEFALKNSYRPSRSARPWTGAEIAAYVQTTVR